MAAKTIEVITSYRKGELVLVPFSPTLNNLPEDEEDSEPTEKQKLISFLTKSIEEKEEALVGSLVSFTKSAVGARGPSRPLSFSTWSKTART